MLRFFEVLQQSGLLTAGHLNMAVSTNCILHLFNRRILKAFLAVVVLVSR